MTPNANQIHVQRNGEPFWVQNELADPNINISAIDAELINSGWLPDGRWRVETDGWRGSKWDQWLHRCPN